MRCENCYWQTDKQSNHSTQEMKWNAKKNDREERNRTHFKGIIDKTGRFVKNFYVSPVELKKDISILLYNSYYYSESNQHRIPNAKHLNQFLLAHSCETEQYHSITVTAPEHATSPYIRKQLNILKRQSDCRVRIHRNRKENLTLVWIRFNGQLSIADLQQQGFWWWNSFANCCCYYLWFTHSYDVI